MYYKKLVLLIKDIHWDRSFKTLMNAIKDKLNVYMNYTSRGGNLIKPKYNNHIIADYICAHYHNLPYTAIPKFMLK